MKKDVADQQSSKKQTSSITLKPSSQPKFISASELARANVQVMVDISDEDLLEMAIRFEKKHPQ
jgi:hypothetical protein